MTAEIQPIKLTPPSEWPTYKSFWVELIHSHREPDSWDEFVRKLWEANPQRVRSYWSGHYWWGHEFASWEEMLAHTKQRRTIDQERDLAIARKRAMERGLTVSSNFVGATTQRWQVWATPDLSPVKEEEER